MVLSYHLLLSVLVLFRCVPWTCSHSVPIPGTEDLEPDQIPCKYDMFKNGIVSCTNFTDSAVIQCTPFCTGGLVRMGRPYNECYKNKKWRFPFPECVKRVKCRYVNSKELPDTTCTEKGCYTKCTSLEKLIGKRLIPCDWFKDHSMGHAGWLRCVNKYFNAFCPEPAENYCLSKANTCPNDTDITLCLNYHNGTPKCNCVDIGIPGNCSAFDKLWCQGRLVDCLSGKFGYTKPLICVYRKGSYPRFPYCGCELKKDLPCIELNFLDRNRSCRLIGEGPNIQCDFLCGPGERMEDCHKKNGRRICSPDGKWDYPPYPRCVRDGTNY